MKHHHFIHLLHYTRWNRCTKIDTSKVTAGSVKDGSRTLVFWLLVAWFKANHRKAEALLLLWAGSGGAHDNSGIFRELGNSQRVTSGWLSSGWLRETCLIQLQSKPLSDPLRLRGYSTDLTADLGCVKQTFFQTRTICQGSWLSTVEQRNLPD